MHYHHKSYLQIGWAFFDTFSFMPIILAYVTVALGRTVTFPETLRMTLWSLYLLTVLGSPAVTTGTLRTPCIMHIYNNNVLVKSILYPVSMRAHAV